MICFPFTFSLLILLSKISLHAAKQLESPIVKVPQFRIQARLHRNQIT